MVSNSKVSGFFILIILLIFVTSHSTAQQFHRIKADYSIKYKDAQGNQVLQMGVVFYDINAKKIVMKNGFPVREIMVQTDTTIFQIRNEQLFNSAKSNTSVNLSIYHLALIGELNNYGLNKSGYTLDTIKSDKGLVLSTWYPPKNEQNIIGKILVSTKGKQLFGIVLIDPNQKIIAKYLYRDYALINGFEFPTEVLLITYQDEKEIFNITNYSKIVIDGSDNEEYYNYKIPSH